MRGRWCRCRQRGVLLGIRSWFGDGCRSVRYWDGTQLHGSPNNLRMDRRLWAYRRCGRSVLHHVRLLDRDMLWCRVRLRGWGRGLGRDRWGQQVRLLRHGVLIDRVRLRHERICRRDGEHPSCESRQYQDGRAARHQSHHGVTQTEHNFPQATPTRVLLP